MAIKLNTFKKALGIKWIRAKSGSTFLCPVAALDSIENPSERQLRDLCVEESLNPQND